MLGGFLYFGAVALLTLVNVAAWLSNLVLMPGNWLVLGFTAAFVFFTPEDAPRQISWTTVGILAAIAVLGELVEMLAGALGAAKQGASKRSVALSLLGALAGGFAGLAVGVPVPVVGPLVGAVMGAAAGSFLGAYAGEHWKYGDQDRAVSAGMSAMLGRLLGTTGKLALGAIMVAVAAVDAIW